MKLFNVFVSAAVATSLVSFVGIHEARAEDTVQRSETQPNRGMLGSGIFTFGVPYVASVVVAASSNHPGDHNLYVPVAGPWMRLADRHCSGGGHCDDGLNEGLLVVNGIFQGLGALDIVSAFFFLKRSASRAQSGTKRPRPRRRFRSGLRVSALGTASRQSASSDSTRRGDASARDRGDETSGGAIGAATPLYRGRSQFIGTAFTAEARILCSAVRHRASSLGAVRSDSPSGATTLP